MCFLTRTTFWLLLLCMSTVFITCMWSWIRYEYGELEDAQELLYGSYATTLAPKTIWQPAAVAVADAAPHEQPTLSPGEQPPMHPHSAPAQQPPVRPASTSSRPSLSRPFVFFHMPKVGGTSLRKRFYSAFPGETMMIPGESGVSNNVQEWELLDEKLVNRTSCAVAFLGHFRLGNLAQVLLGVDAGQFGAVRCNRGWPRLPDNTSGAVLTSTFLDLIECLIVVREPLARLWSDYYHKRRAWATKEFTKVRLADALDSAGAGRVLELTYGNVQTEFLTRNASGVPTDEYMRQCKMVPYEKYDIAMDWLAKLYPEFSGSQEIHFKGTASYKGDGDITTLTPEHRTTLARSLTADGALYATVWDYNAVSGDGPACGGSVGHQGMCWDAQGGFQLPPAAS